VLQLAVSGVPVSLRDRLRAFRDLPLAVTSVYSRVCDVHSDVRELLRRPPPPMPPPFVCVLAEGDSDRGPMTLGAAGRVTDNRGSPELTLRTQVPLRDVRVTVFCDLERVAVHGVFVGVDMVTASLGECPTVRFPMWNVGVVVRVQCLLRDDPR
jgi:hypothetical protein